MPHALGDAVNMDGDETQAAEAYLANCGSIQAQLHNFLNREIDQSDKHAEAMDFEDIGSDDDLPEEEEATQLRDEEDDELNQFLGGTANGASYPKGQLHSSQEPRSDEASDLFGDRTSSPEHQRRHSASQLQRPGLALPSKSALALPQAQPWQQQQMQPFQQDMSSMSPPDFTDDAFSPAASENDKASDEEEDLAELDEETRMQRMLFAQSKRRQMGSLVEEDSEEVDAREFWSYFPRYESDHAPFFLDLFPQRPVQYRGKVPPKPPKPVQPTKLTLDLLPDQERTFKSLANVHRHDLNAGQPSNLVHLRRSSADGSESEEDYSLGFSGDEEYIGGKSLADLTLICQTWDVATIESSSMIDEPQQPLESDWDAEEGARPTKRRKVGPSALDVPINAQIPPSVFEDPEHAAARIAKRVTLDLNDGHLLIDEHAPQSPRKGRRIPGDIRRDQALTRDLARRYNISNDEAYDLLKENHQHKVRSTLGTTALEHSLPAKKLQFPFYKIALDAKAKRSFHRPALTLKEWEIKPAKEFKMGKLKKIKNKERKGQDVKDLFATSESLAFDDNSKMLLLEYSEEAPMMMSNFGMGNKVVNYYRKRNADDQERPKREIGELHVLLTQDKSPFANFGHVDQGETVPTIQNGLYRAPIFRHDPRPTDFFVSISTTHQFGTRMNLRNLENLYTVGQQLPVAEVPTAHSRKVTEAAKRRLQVLAYRLHIKSQDPTRRDKTLDNITLMKHLKGHDMPQTRSKMREFMDYQRNPNREGGVWVPKTTVPDLETLRGWVTPEQICLLDSMQAGVQRLLDLGIDEKGKSEKDDDKDIDENATIEEHLAPWRATKTFLLATQGKAMLKLHGDGDPTGRGEAFSFVKINMKGGFQPLGESVEDKLDAKRRRENGGHTYNVAKQQKAYDDYIRMIWEKQKNSLSSNIEISDTEMDDEPDGDVESTAQYGRGGTPRSSFAGTPAAFARRGDDETGTQVSRQSGNRDNKRIFIIDRVGTNAYGEAESEPIIITNPRVAREYKKRKAEKMLENIDLKAHVFGKPGNEELDKLIAAKIEEERDRVQRNIERREHREKLKKRASGAGSPSASNGGSPDLSESESTMTGIANGSANGTPHKGGGGRGGRNKDGTARKCANCGQVGHIKTNRKLCPLLNGTMKPDGANLNGDSSFGAVPAPLTL